MNQVVLSVNVEQREVPLVLSGAYQKRHTGFSAANKLIGWVVRKLFEPYRGSYAEYRQVLVDYDDIVKMILDRAVNIESVFRRKPKTLLIGAREWDDVCNNMHCTGQLIQFGFPKDYVARVNPESMRNTFAGMRVIIVPWMQGLLLLPELDGV